MTILIKKKKLILLIALSISILTILYYHSVDKTLTKDDYEYIPKYLINVNQISKESTYKEELDFISSVQRSTIDIVSRAGSIPINQQREPKELYLAKVGGCADRSRLIEKILIYNGFKTRHFSMYSTEKTNSSIKSLITPKIKSHAASEVLTKKGWLVIDSNFPWIALDVNNNPLSIKKIQQSVDNSVDIDWKKSPLDVVQQRFEKGYELTIYTKPFVAVYGIYSRHGRFYPPYNLIPDINYGELIQNAF